MGNKQCKVRKPLITFRLNLGMYTYNNVREIYKTEWCSASSCPVIPIMEPISHRLGIVIFWWGMQYFGVACLETKSVAFKVPSGDLTRSFEHVLIKYYRGGIRIFEIPKGAWPKINRLGTTTLEGMHWSHLLYHLQKDKNPLRKREGMSMEPNCITCWISSSGDLRIMEFSFITIAPRFTLIWSGSTC